MAQISLSLASAGGHPCPGTPKTRENRFQMRDQWILGIKGHPWGKPALMEPGASVREKAQKEGKRKEKNNGGGGMQGKKGKRGGAR